MAVADLQSWADNLEVVRLPAIEADITALEAAQTSYAATLASTTQTWMDNLSAHLALINAAQADADAAQADAADTTARVYGVDVSLQAYVNSQISALRTELTALNAQLDAYIKGPLATSLSADVTAILPQLQAEVAANTTAVNALMATVQAELNSIDAANNTLINTDFPAQSAQVATLQSAVTNAQNTLDVAFTDYPYANLVDGLQNVQALVEGHIQSLGVYVCRAPHTSWTREPETATFSKLPVLPAWFVTDDAVFGDALELPAGTDEAIGQAYPLPYDAAKFYRVTVRLRVVGDGTSSGVQLKLGASTFLDGVAADTAVERTLSAANATVANGELTFQTVFSGDATALTDAGYSLGSGAANTATVLPSAANKIFFYLRQNPALATDGQVRVHSIQVDDVTEAYLAAAVIRQDVSVINNKLSAGIMLRVDAGDADGSLELVAADDPIEGASSVLRIKADNIIFNGSIKEAHIEDAAIGNAKIKDTISSDNYVAGTSGWSINKLGNAEFNNLVVRDWLQDGSVSDGGDSFIAGPSQSPDGTVIDTISLGQTVIPDTVFTISVHSEYKRYGEATVMVKGYPERSLVWTRLQLQYRTKSAGVWSGWVVLSTSSISYLTTWSVFTYSTTFVFNNEDAEVRLITDSNGTPNTPEDNVRNTWLLLRSLPRR
jgi:hypothetical protein